MFEVETGQGAFRGGRTIFWSRLEGFSGEGGGLSTAVVAFDGEEGIAVSVISSDMVQDDWKVSVEDQKNTRIRDRNIDSERTQYLLGID